MLTGRLGHIMELIPIALSVLVIASLIEAFPILTLTTSGPKKPNQKWPKLHPGGWVTGIFGKKP